MFETAQGTPTGIKLTFLTHTTVVGVVASGSSDSHPKYPTSFTMFCVTLEASNARPDPHNKSGCEDR
jgi:hypothetical protein